MNFQMVLNNTNKNNSILLEVFASVFTVSSYFTDNPRISTGELCLKKCSSTHAAQMSNLWITVQTRSFPTELRREICGVGFKRLLYKAFLTEQNISFFQQTVKT